AVPDSRGASVRADLHRAVGGGRAAVVAGVDLSLLDWAQPWFDGVAQAGECLAEAGPLHARLNGLLPADPSSSRTSRLQVASGKPLAFVPQADLAAGAAYETHIYQTGGVPTRDNLHDLLNGLVWLS